MKKETLIRIKNSYLQNHTIAYGKFFEDLYTLSGGNLYKVGLDHVSSKWYHNPNVYAFEYNCPMKTTIKKSKKKLPKYKIERKMRNIHAC